MEDLNKKDLLDNELANLERHSPSMRFSKSVVEKVKLETDLIREERNPIRWIPRVLWAGTSLVFVILVVLLSNNDIQIGIQPSQKLVEYFTIGIVVPGGLLLFLGFDRLLKRILVK